MMREYAKKLYNPFMGDTDSFTEWHNEFVDTIYDDFEKEMKELRVNARDKVYDCDYPKETFESIFGYNYKTDEKIDLL